MMTFYPLLVLFLAMVPSLTIAQDACCAPDKLTFEVVYSGQTQYTNYVDWTIKKAFESYGGNGGISWKLYDGNKMEYYVRKTDGGCKKYPITMPWYVQCVPDNAVHVSVDPEYNVVLDGWRYNVNSHTTRLVIVNRNGCLPYRIHQTTDDVTSITAFVNMAQTITDPSVFQSDVSDCTSA